MGNQISDYIALLYMSASLFLITTYAYFKTSVISIHSLYRRKLTITLGCLVISIIFTMLYPINSGVAQIIGFLYPPVFFAAFEKQNRIKVFLICFILSAFSRVMLTVSTMLLSIVLVMFNSPKRVIYTIIILYVLTFVFVFLVLKIKRFRKGFQFFQYEKNIGLGLAISGISFVLIGIIYLNNYMNDYISIVITLGLVISGFGLFIWIRRSITAHYRERLQLKSEEHFQALLKEKEIENQKLNQTNEYLAKVVHRDNHLMSALDTSINAYFESDNEQYKDNLLREIQMLTKERGELIEKEQRDAKLLSTTGNLLIDGAVNDLYIKAAAHGIDFDLTVSETVDAIIGKYISQTDLQTLLCDHIKDAIIAVDAKGNDKGTILVDFSVKNENYQITVFDSGVDFEIDTLTKLGKERVTTHADNGGSGIGFMTTFETLRKAYASLMITEFAHKTPFSKSVSIIFDGENSFIIQSYRSDILKTAINRNDMVII